MPPKFKRKLSTTNRSPSPPAVRRKTSTISSPTQCPAEEPTTLRVYSWNVNGIGPLLQKQISFDPGTTFPIRSFLKRHLWPSLLCLQEVKVSSKDSATQNRISLAVNAGCLAGEPRYTTELSLPRDKYNATGFGGKVHGVATFIRTDLATTVHTWRPDWDLEGRVLVHELTGLGLTVVNGYWVNGTTLPYRNPNTGDVEGTRHDHKLRFHGYMLQLALDAIRERKQHVVLVGDMNVARSRVDGHPNLRTSPVQHVRNRAAFNSKFFTDKTGLNGVDVYRELHGERRKYTYHPRGIPWGSSCDRVDLIIADPGLHGKEAILDTDICDNPLDRGHSDHVPLWIKIDMGLLKPSDKNLPETDHGKTSPRA